MTNRRWQQFVGTFFLAAGFVGLMPSGSPAQMQRPDSRSDAPPVIGRNAQPPAKSNSTTQASSTSNSQSKSNASSNTSSSAGVRSNPNAVSSDSKDPSNSGTSADDEQAQAQSVETVELFDPGEQKSTGTQSNVEVGSLGEVDMAVKDLEITKALQVLSIQSQKNIIASRNVSGKVTANLYGVGFYDALDAILHPNGYGYQERGNMIYVYTQKELEKRRKANRQTVHKMINLNYISAEDANGFVSPLLSPDGKIAISGKVEAGLQPSLGDAGANTSAHGGRLVVVDYEENVEEIKDLIAELDTKPKQVLVEATILQVRLNENNALGVDFAAFSDLQVDNFTSPLNAVDDLIAGEGANGNSIDSGNAITTSAGNVSSPDAGAKVGFLGSDAGVFVRALDQVNDTTVLATPKILALNRQKAELNVGDRLGYLSTTVNDQTQTQTVEFLDVGTQLTLRPFISNDGYIRMELRPSVSDGNTDRVVDGNVVPDETSQTLVTNVMVPNGQTIVLGGLFSEDTTTNTNQLPGLGNVPVIGWLGKGQDDSVRRSEVIFMIKPTIMEDTPLAKMSDDLNNRVMQALPGAREGLLPFSRTKLTAHYMKEANQALEAGDKDKALWNANLALHVDPTMIDALRVKRQLSGEQLFYHNQSMLNRAVDGVIDEQIGDMDEIDLDMPDDQDSQKRNTDQLMNPNQGMDDHAMEADDASAMHWAQPRKQAEHSPSQAAQASAEAGQSEARHAEVVQPDLAKSQAGESTDGRTRGVKPSANDANPTEPFDQDHARSQAHATDQPSRTSTATATGTSAATAPARQSQPATLELESDSSTPSDSAMAHQTDHQTPPTALSQARRRITEGNSINETAFSGAKATQAHRANDDSKITLEIVDDQTQPGAGDATADSTKASAEASARNPNGYEPEPQPALDADRVNELVYATIPWFTSPADSKASNAQTAQRDEQSTDDPVNFEFTGVDTDDVKE